MSSEHLGASGRLARAASRSPLTPLLAITALLAGLFAALVTPREEEPQIDVTMANVFIDFPGAAVADVEQLVASPMEQVLAEIQGVEHITSVSRPGQAVITVQFEVGVPRTEALVRLYNAIYSNQDWRPAGLGVQQPVVKPKGIDDVPVVALTLWSDDPARGGFDLRLVAHALETELLRVPGTRDVDTIGGPEQVVRLLLDPQRLAARGISLPSLRAALQAANSVSHAGAVTGDDRTLPVQAGEFFSHPDELATLVIGLHQGQPVYLRDVADIRPGAAENQRYVWHAARETGNTPAVTLSISKKPGENAVTLARTLLDRVEQLKGSVIPDGVQVSVTRNYGATADDKASTLITKLVFATLSVVALVLFALGRREALVVGAAVVLTLAATLFASWAWGFTLNRVSLFALIFSIGILVDDAIVVVENIHRHGASGGRLLDSIPRAVDEVGGPTILATFTVIAALLPMAFVTGLMGPYMSPIPINASLGMAISLVVAFTVTPWLAGRFLPAHAAPGTPPSEAEAADPRLLALAERVLAPFLGNAGRGRRYRLGGVLIALILASMALVGLQWVVMKMLPFDNKSEFQVIVDMPEGTPVERTSAVLARLADALLEEPEVTNLQAYAGTAAPIGFNGLVRQYYLRQSPHLGDIQVNLADRRDRDRDSHTIALAVRPRLAALGRELGADVQVVEVPPGPPVQAPLVAEVYGPDHAGQQRLAGELRARFEQTAHVVDVNDSREADSPRLRVTVDRQRAAHLGVAQADASTALATVLGDEDVTYLHTGHARYPIPVRLAFSEADKRTLDQALALRLLASDGGQVPLREIARVQTLPWQQSIHHKDLLPVVYVTGDVAGGPDSPLYGMFDLVGQLGDSLPQYFIRQPGDAYQYSVKWDGEWQITYETFRDMGAAYSVGLVLIYLLVVAQFRSYRVPLVIMAPIPLTLIGILPGHALLGAQFTATSMIGMIALAGIIVRNSILLVDFVNHALAAGQPLERAVILASAVRARPIVLTALAAMLGALFILDDPIFNGLAVSLLSGMLVSTALTLVVIPLLYYSLLRRQRATT